MRWVKEVLEFIVNKGDARYEEVRRGVNLGHLIPTASLTEVLNNLKKAKFIVQSSSGVYRVGEGAKEALKLVEHAEEGELALKRGEAELFQRALKANLLKMGRLTLSVPKPNPKDWPQILNVDVVIRLPCGHNIPSQFPWPEKVVCPECGRVYPQSASFRCVCGMPRDIRDFVDGDLFFCRRCGKWWEVKGTRIEAVPLLPVLLPRLVARAEEIFPILSSHPVRSVISKVKKLKHK